MLKYASLVVTTLLYVIKHRISDIINNKRIGGENKMRTVSVENLCGAYELVVTVFGLKKQCNQNKCQMHVMAHVCTHKQEHGKYLF